MSTISTTFGLLGSLEFFRLKDQWTSVGVNLLRKIDGQARIITGPMCGASWPLQMQSDTMVIPVSGEEAERAIKADKYQPKAQRPASTDQTSGDALYRAFSWVSASDLVLIVAALRLFAATGEDITAGQSRARDIADLAESAGAAIR